MIREKHTFERFKVENNYQQHYRKVEIFR